MNWQMTKHLLFAALICSFLHVPLIAAPNASSAGLDESTITWESLSGALKAVSQNRDVRDGSVEYWIRWAQSRQLRRDLGLKLWEEYPEDARRLHWLRSTIIDPPFYWKDMDQGARSYANERPDLAIIDYSAKQAWEDKYVALRAEYFSAPEVTDEMRMSFRYYELRNEISDLQYQDRHCLQLNLRLLTNKVLDYFRDNKTASVEYVRSLADTWHRVVDEYPELDAAFVRALKRSSRSELHMLANGWEQAIRLRGLAMEIRGTSLDGAPIDVATLRGKIVLVDFWSLGCSSCVEQLPQMQRVYDRYRDHGFEIVGFCLSFGRKQWADKARLQRLLNEKGVSWANALLEGEIEREVRERYSIISVPVTFLLDQNGMLVTTDVHGPKLEKEVRRLLGLPPLDVKSTEAQTSEPFEQANGAYEPLTVVPVK